MGSVDAVVVGSGAAGGLAALLLTEAGLRVLVLEAGPCKGGPSVSRWLTNNALRLLEPLNRGQLTGERDGLSWLPDSQLSYLLGPTANQFLLQRAIEARWPAAKSVVGRFAPPLKAIEAAAKTGRLTLRQGAIAREILVDSSGRTQGIVWVDQQSGPTERINVPLIFVCASTLESTRLLLLSRLGAASGVLGCNLMDHIMVTVKGLAPPLVPSDDGEQGRCLYLPRFDARNYASKPPPVRGFGVQIYQSPLSSFASIFFAASFSEMAPRPENRVMLDPKRVDAWGIPILRIECGYDQSERSRASGQAETLRELAEIGRVRFASISKPAPPGSAIHECGTARKGTDPSNSVLDSYNQCWEARGLYVTDGASFPSQGAHNPTLTILALTARACDHAIRNAR